MSPSPRLSKWKRNQIFEAIKGGGLDPKDFDLNDGDAEGRIKHRWSESYFTIGGDPSHYVGNRIVGDGLEMPYDVYSWESVIQRVSGWVGEVKRDSETPDLWTELQCEADLLGGGFNDATENTPFSSEEQKEIARRLKELSGHARQTYSLSEPSMQILKARIDYLIGAAGRLGRIDWRNAFAGAILGYVLGAALSPEDARHIVLTLFRAIGHLYGLPELPGG
jgi:hypothetical protein